MSTAWKNRLWGIGLGFHCLLIWGVPYFYVQDGPAHAYSAFVLWELLTGSDALLSQSFSFNEWTVPCWVSSFSMALVVTIFGPVVGMKVVLTGVVAALALGYRTLCREFRSRGSWSEFFIYLFLYNHLLMMGLLPFLFSTGVSMGLVASGLRVLRTGTRRQWMLLGSFFLMAYFIHPIPPAIAGVILVGRVLVLDLILPADRDRGNARNKLAGLALVGTVPGCLALAYVVSAPSTPVQETVRGIGEVVGDLGAAGILVSFSMEPHWWGTVAMAAMVAVSGAVLLDRLHRKTLEPVDGCCLLLVGLIMGMATIREGVLGASLLSYRLSLVFWVVWLIWLAVSLARSRLACYEKGLAGVLIVASLFQWGSIYQNQREVQPLVKSLRAAGDEITRGAVVWSLVENPQGRREAKGFLSPRNDFLAHSGLLALIRRDPPLLANAYQAQTRHFAIRYREGWENHSLDSARPRHEAGSTHWLLRVGVQESNDRTSDIASQWAWLTEAPVFEENTPFGRVQLFRVPMAQASGRSSKK